MTSPHNSSAASPDSPPLLEKALEKSQIVKDKIEDCALELSGVNETVKKEMAAGITLQQRKEALAQSQGVENKVQECADELHGVNEVLAKEIEDREALNRKLQETERKLSAANNILSNMGDVLTQAHQVARKPRNVRCTILSQAFPTGSYSMSTLKRQSRLPSGAAGFWE